MFHADCDEYRSGTAQPFMLTVQSFLLERAKENDHDSPFTKTLFKVCYTLIRPGSFMNLTIPLVSILINRPDKRDD
jgi:hypothetical protein